MLHTVEYKFSQFKHLNTNKPVLVGVSGGADSIVLAHLLQKAGVKIGIAHCHFNLRADDADRDQDFSRQFAEMQGVPFFTVRFETKTYAETRKISIQMAARNLRYFWFEKICKENGFDQIAVGTHLTDNIETYLINSTRGTGLSGLRGIKPVSGRIIRPLLEVTKQDIYDYAKTEKLEWREDLSNQSI
jgi:tRNA(Ile)-lysidine synthase